jgi:hypothetical protein
MLSMLRPSLDADKDDDRGHMVTLHRPLRRRAWRGVL